jgi:hypothetical protein
VAAEAVELVLELILAKLAVPAAGPPLLLGPRITPALLEQVGKGTLVGPDALPVEI